MSKRTALSESAGDTPDTDLQTIRHKAAMASAPLASSIDEVTRTAWFCLSKYCVDRDGEVLVPEGCDLTNYPANPQVLLEHEGKQWPVGQGKQVDVRPGDGVYMQVEFTELDLPDDNPAKQVAEACWAMVKAGTLRAMSAGFRALKVDRKPVLAGQTGVTFLRWEPVEASIVKIPANPQALIKSLGDGADERAARLIFPELVASLRSDPEAYSDLRFRGDLARAAKALRGANNHLRHLTKALPGTINKAFALTMMLRDADVVGAPGRPSLLGELATMGQLLDIDFIPDEWAEDRVQADIDGDGEEGEWANYGGRTMPGRTDVPAPSDMSADKGCSCGGTKAPGACEECGTEGDICRQCGGCADCCACAEPQDKHLQGEPRQSHAATTPAPRTPTAEADDGVPSGGSGITAEQITEVVGSQIAKTLAARLPEAIQAARAAHIGGKPR